MQFWPDESCRNKRNVDTCTWQIAMPNALTQGVGLILLMLTWAARPAAAPIPQTWPLYLGNWFST